MRRPRHNGVSPKSRATAKRRLRGRFFRPLLEQLEDRTLLNAVSWVAPQSGFWDVAGNWSTDQVPTANDDVTINQPGVTVTVRDAEAARTLAGSDALALSSPGALTVGAASTFDGNITLPAGTTLTLAAATTLGGTVTLSGGSLVTNDVLTLGGAATWSGGTISGSGSLATAGTGALDAANSGTLTLALPLNNAGTVDVQSGTLSITGTVSQVSGTTLTGGTWDVANNATLGLGNTPNLTASQATVALAGPNAAFTQFATVTNMGGSLALTNGANFSAAGDLTVSGSVSLDTGTLQLNNHALTISSGGSLAVGNANGLSGEGRVTDAGTLSVAGGTGTLTLSAGLSLQGGTLNVQSGTLDVAGGDNGHGTLIVSSTGGTFDVAPQATVQLSSFGILTGTYTGSGGGTVRVTQNFGPTIQIGNAATDTVTFDFPAGMLQIGDNVEINGPGTLLNAQGGFLTTADTGNGVVLTSGRLENAGTLDIGGTAGLVFQGASGVVTNDATGTISFQSNASVGSNATIMNHGAITKAAGTGTSAIAAVLDNQGGTLSVQSGTLNVAGNDNGHGTPLGDSTGGTFNVAPQATLQLSSFGILTGTYTGSGGGTVRVAPNFGPTIQIGSAATDTATFDFPAGMLQVGDNVQINGPGTLVNAQGGFLTTADTGNGVFLTSGRLENAGTLDIGGVSGLNFRGANGIITNDATGTISFPSNAGIGVNATVTNLGAITKAAGTGTSAIGAVLDNQGGTLDVQSGTLAIGSVNNTDTYAGGTFTVAGGAVLQLSGNRGTSVMTGSFTGSGAGQVQLAGGSGGIHVGTSAGDSATLNFPSGLFVMEDNSEVDGPGRLVNAASGSITTNDTNNGVFLGNGATLENAGTLNLAGKVGVNLRDSGSSLVNDAGGTINLPGAQSISGSGTFINRGTVNASPGSGKTTSLASVFDDQGGTINLQSGTLNIGTNNTAGTSTGGTFNVSSGATLNLVAGDDAPVMTGTYTGTGGGSVIFNNTIHVGAKSSDTATFNFAPGMFQWQNASFTGPGTLTNAGDMQLVNGSFKTVTNSGTFINTGTMTWNFPGSADFAAFTADSSSQIINRGTVHWLSGLTAGFTNDVGGTLSLEGAGNKTVGFNATLTNKGTIVEPGTVGLSLGVGGSGGFSTGEVFNAAGALYDLQSDAGITIGDGQVINAGTVRKSGGTGTSTLGPGFFDHENDTIDVETGTIAIPRNGEISTGGTFTVAANAVLDLSGAAGDDENNLVGTYTGSGAGHVELTHGTLALGGRGGADLNTAVLDLTGGGFLWTGGQLDATNFNGPTTFTNEGQFTVGPGFTASEAAELTNSGTLTIDADSTLNVNNTYTQTSTGTLSVQLGGTGSGQSGKLVSTGAAQLDGTLQATLVNGYTPAAGDTLTVQQYPSETGTYAHFDLPSGGGVGFSAAVQPTSVVLTGAALATDLAVQSIDSITPAAGIAGQNETVHYTVVNNGKATPVSSWEDSVFLTTGTTLDASAVLLGRVPHSGGLSAGGVYHGTLTAPIPGVLPGNYHVIVEADSGDQVPDANRGNNVLVSPGTLGVGFNPLVLNSTASGTVAAGQTAYYQLDLSAGQNVQISTTLGAANAAALLVGYRYVPTGSTFDELAATPNQTSEEVTLTATQAGTYFIALQGQSAAGTGTSYTLSATTNPLGIATFSPTAVTEGQAIQSGQVVTSFIPTITLTVTGNQFTPNTAVSLVRGSTTVPAQQVTFQDAQTLYATFAQAQVPVGTYQVEVSDQGQTATAPGTLSVSLPSPSTSRIRDVAVEVNGQVVIPPGPPAPDVTVDDSVQIHFDAPSGLAAGGVGSIVVTYTNVSGADAPAPLILLHADNGSFQLPGQLVFTPNTFAVLAINQHGPAGILPPGASGSVVVNYQQSDTSDLFAGVVDPTTTIDWAAAEAGMKPPGVTDAAWNATFQNFTNAVGSTFDSLQTALDNAATYLSRLGEYTASADELTNFLLEQAGDFGAIAQRNQPSPFGLGMPDPNVTATTDPSGNVFIHAGSLIEPFDLQADGSYRAAPGDNSVLSLSGGAFQLRRADGTMEVFNPDGTLNAIKNPNGTAVNYAYTGGRLTSIANTQTGDVATYTYNGQGLVSQVADSNGTVSTLTYDAAGRLLSVDTPPGPVTYTYVVNADPATANAVQSVTYPNGSQVNYTYDGQGRLVGETQAQGAEPLTFSYDEGAVTVTNADHDAATSFYDDAMQLVAYQSPSGNLTRFGIDANGDPTQATGPGGVTNTFTYNALGDPLAITNPLGQGASATYSPTFNRLASLTDPNGNTTQFGYDGNGNATSITYADGSQATYGYDPAGNLLSATDANGTAVHYVYDAQNELIEGDFADGSKTTFGYDALHNITSVTDANGTEHFVYNAADELTSVAYANGLQLHYAYNASGQRTQVVDQTGFTVNYQYDSAGRLADLTDGSGTSIVRYTYDAAGLLVRKDLGNGTFTAYTYDPDGNVTDIVNHAPDGSVLSSYAYAYDEFDRPVRMTTQAGTTTYGYDATGQLTSVGLPDGSSITYQYDANGNRVAVVDNGATTTYATNNRNEYTTVGNTQYVYDKDGNLVSSADSSGTTTYTYDAHNELVQVVSPQGITTYQYDALGNLIGTAQNGQETQVLTDPTTGFVVGTFDGSGQVTAEYTVGLGLVSQVSGGGASAFYNFDVTGNTTELTGGSGAVLNTYSYLPFGEQLSATGNAPNPYTYVAQQGVLSAGNGLFYMHNRYYAPGLGRFTQGDPLGLFGGDTNIYRYAGNSPVQFTDPSGLALSALAYAAKAEQLAQDLQFFANQSQTAATVARAQNAVQQTQQALNAVRASQAAQAAATQGTTTAGAAATEGGAAAATEGAVATAEGAVVTTTVEGGGAAATTVASGAAVEGGVTVGGTIGTVGAGESIAGLGLGPVAALGTVVAVTSYTATTAVLNATNANGDNSLVALLYNDGNGSKRQYDPPSNPKGALLGSLNDTDFSQADQACIKAFLAAHPQTGIGPALIHCGFDPGLAKLIILTLKSHDPNSLTGPAGFGSQGFVPGGATLPYRIDFENEPTATAPAQVVTVTEQLDPSLDLSTFQFGTIGFGNQSVTVPAGVTSFHTRIDATASVGVFVDVDANLNLQTGVATWTFTSIDPTTLDQPTGNPLEGFLPPDTKPPLGEGFVTYTVQPKAGEPTGAVVNAQAQVVFDTNAPLDTVQVSNTLDAGAPTSSVNTLPATTSNPVIPVSWSGQDDAGGSGIATFDVFVSDNGGAFQPLLLGTTQTSTAFTGQAGHTYGFFTVATDNVGNVQVLPTAAQAVISVIVPPPANSSPPPAPPSAQLTGTSLVVSADSPGGDTIFFLPGRRKGQVTVVVDGRVLGTFRPRQIIAFGGPGSSVIAVDRRIKLPAFLFGGPGNDILIGGGGSNFLDGGPGSNTLIPGPGRNQLIGGGPGSGVVIAGGPNGNFIEVSRRGGRVPELVVDENGQEYAFPYLQGSTVTVEGSGGGNILVADASLRGHWRVDLVGGPGRNLLIDRTGSALLEGSGRTSLLDGIGHDRLVNGLDVHRITDPAALGPLVDLLFMEDQVLA